MPWLLYQEPVNLLLLPLTGGGISPPHPAPGNPELRSATLVCAQGAWRCVWRTSLGSAAANDSFPGILVWGLEAKPGALPARGRSSTLTHVPATPGFLKTRDHCTEPYRSVSCPRCCSRWWLPCHSLCLEPPPPGPCLAGSGPSGFLQSDAPS